MRSLNLVLLTVLTASSLAAQAYNYPALQTPRIVDREYNFAAASAGNAGTSLLFQWREGLNEDWQFSLDGGLASPKGGGNTRVLVAGGLAWQWVRSTADMPFDIAATGSAGFSSGAASTWCAIPVGAVVGHTFKLDNGNELTPFVHPRLRSISAGEHSRVDAPAVRRHQQLETRRRRGRRRELRDHSAGRRAYLAGLLGGTSYVGSTNAIGFSVAWTPKGLKKF